MIQRLLRVFTVDALQIYVHYNNVYSSVKAAEAAATGQTWITIADKISVMIVLGLLRSPPLPPVPCCLSTVDAPVHSELALILITCCCG